MAFGVYTPALDPFQVTVNGITSCRVHKFSCSDSLGTITAAGYLNTNLNASQLAQINSTDMVQASYNGGIGLFQPSIATNGVITLLNNSGDVNTFDGDTGTATGSIITIKTGFPTNSGSTFEFVASGSQIQLNVTDASNNTIFGKSAGNGTLTASNCACFGFQAGILITTANNSAIFGSNAGHSLTTGINNSFFGNAAGGACISGGGNTLIGKGAASNLITGGSNIVLGVSAASNYTSNETGNIIIGHAGVALDNSVIRIGTNQTLCFIAGIAGTNASTVTSPCPAFLDVGTGQLVQGNDNSPVTVSGTSKTLALTDAYTWQICSNVASQTITVPTNASVPCPLGTEITFFQQGAGQVIFTNQIGVTLQSISGNLKISAQYGRATLRQIIIDTWALVGDLAA